MAGASSTSFSEYLPPELLRGKRAGESLRPLSFGAALALCASIQPASAQRVVKAGYDTYYFSGTTADPLNPANPNERGNTVQQADNILNKLQGMLQKEVLTFADVVQAHVFLVTDPA